MVTIAKEVSDGKTQEEPPAPRAPAPPELKHWMAKSVNLLEIIKFLETGEDVDAQLEAFNQLNAFVTEQDLPVLIEAMKSETSNFWVRELLAEPICRLGGAKEIAELMAALRRNFDEGHDNDGFQAFLADLAESDPKGVKAELEKLRETANKAELEDIQWLLEFCQ